MLEEQKKIQKRQIAVKVSISELLSGKYVREEGLMPNYIETADGKKISRVNIIGTVVFKFDEESLNYKNFVIDDEPGGLPCTARGSLDRGYFKTFPHRNNMDGFFSVRLRRVT